MTNVCQYSARHTMQGVPATTTIYVLVWARHIPACEACATFYTSH